MKQQRKQLLSKILLLALTIMIVIGFTLPTFLNNEPQTQQAERRICQTDSDCYLMCGEEQNQPVSVICTENLCQQNSCEEWTPYPYQAEPVAFELKIENLNLKNSSQAKDLFVKFEGSQVKVFTAGLSLERILEKLDYTFVGEQLELNINGDTSSYYGGYVPQQGDKIEIKTVTEKTVKENFLTNSSSANSSQDYFSEDSSSNSSSNTNPFGISPSNDNSS